MCFYQGKIRLLESRLKVEEALLKEQRSKVLDLQQQLSRVLGPVDKIGGLYLHITKSGPKLGKAGSTASRVVSYAVLVQKDLLQLH
jgi:hypothetical protein